MDDGTGDGANIHTKASVSSHTPFSFQDPQYKATQPINSLCLKQSVPPKKGGKALFKPKGTQPESS